MTTYTVYKLYDAQDELLYVGFTARGFRRIDEHLREKPWFDAVTDIQFERFANEHRALDREASLVLLQNPRYNVAYKQKSF